MVTVTTAKSLDRRDKTITTFVVYDAAAELRGMQEGEVLELLTDDFEPFASDIAAWCEAGGHTLLANEAVAGGRRFLIQKGTAADKDTSLAMVVSSHRLEELLSPLGFALAAALEGIKVNLFIQGPGVRVLKRGFTPKLAGWARPFSRFAAAGMAKSGHILPQEKLRQLHHLGATIYMCAPSMQRFRVRKEDLIFDDLPMVEYLTFMALMERSSINMYS